MISIREMTFDYGRPSEFRLRVPGLDIREGERVAMIGPSGCGKTSLAYLISGILRPGAGEVSVGGFRVDTASDEQRRVFRAGRVGFVFQEFELIDYLRARDNILVPYAINPSLTRPDSLTQRADELARRMDISDRLDRYPQSLSQGEKQRVAICRALVTRPVLLIGDEPTGGLDAEHSQATLDLVFEEASSSGATLLLITHDHSLLNRFDRIIDVSSFAERGKP